MRKRLSREQERRVAQKQEQTAARRDLPTVVITGHADEELRRRAFENGAVAVLLKPFDDQGLLDAIERALKR